MANDAAANATAPSGLRSRRYRLPSYATGKLSCLKHLAWSGVSGSHLVPGGTNILLTSILYCDGSFA